MKKSLIKKVAQIKIDEIKSAVYKFSVEMQKLKEQQNRLVAEKIKDLGKKKIEELKNQIK